MAGIRRLTPYGLGVILVMVAALGVLVSAAPTSPMQARPVPAWRLQAVPAPAPTLQDPPNVAGLPLVDAEKALTDWNPKVVFLYQPSVPTQPSGEIDKSGLGVLQYRYSNAFAAGQQEPRITLLLGALLPDVLGLNREQAIEALSARQLGAAFEPLRAPADWVVASQKPDAGTVTPFESTVVLVLGLAPTESAAATESPSPSPTPVASPTGGGRDDNTIFTPTVVAVATGTGLGVLVALLLTTLTLRRHGRRDGRRGDRRDRPDEPAVPEHVQVLVSAGRSSGPDVTEPRGAVSLSVRLETYSDPGSVSIEERGR